MKADFKLKLSEIAPNEVNALLKKECPGYTGYVLTQGGNQFEEGVCNVCEQYKNECVLSIWESTQKQLEMRIIYFKQLNSHAKCTTINPQIVYYRVNNEYRTTLHFTF